MLLEGAFGLCHVDRARPGGQRRQASQPNQIEEDLETEEVARKAGAREFVFYQLSRADVNQGKWNTGIE